MTARCTPESARPATPSVASTRPRSIDVAESRRLRIARRRRQPRIVIRRRRSMAFAVRSLATGCMMPLSRLPPAYACNAASRNSARLAMQDRHELLRRTPTLRAVAAGTGGRRLQPRRLESRLRGRSAARSSGRPPPSLDSLARPDGGSACRKATTAQTSSSRCCDSPGRHAGIFDAVLDDPEQLPVLPVSRRRGEIGRRRQHVPRYRADRDARGAVAIGAAAVEMTRTERDEIRIV